MDGGRGLTCRVARLHGLLGALFVASAVFVPLAEAHDVAASQRALLRDVANARKSSPTATPTSWPATATATPRPAYTISAIPTPTSTAPGSSVTIAISVTSAVAATLLVDVDGTVLDLMRRMRMRRPGGRADIQVDWPGCHELAAGQPHPLAL